jgi:predicted PurR-regulated permease PerM
VSELERALGGFGIRVDLPGFYEADIAPVLRDFSANALREFMSALAAIVAAISNLLLVIILSLYMSMGGHDLAREVRSLFPRRYRSELFVFIINVNKNFGGFVRGQMLQALLAGVATALIMLVLRLDYVALAAILSGILMLIPLLGVILTLIPPVLVALALGSLPSALIVFAFLFVFQQVMMNVVMPKIMAESVGLHPLLVFAALLIGVRVGGIWGAFFGIPVAGVLWAMLQFAVKQARLQAEIEPASPGVEIAE